MDDGPPQPLARKPLFRLSSMSEVGRVCALVAASMIWLSGSVGTSASAELPTTNDAIMQEAQHAEIHAEPSDEDLAKISRMPRTGVPSDLEPARSVSVGYPNRGLLQFGTRISDEGAIRVKDSSLDMKWHCPGRANCAGRLTGSLVSVSSPAP